ncbi:MAG: transposase [Thiomicrorhabdus sp.]|nr:transposase [Thiomicrorhabdus sp.]
MGKSLTLTFYIDMISLCFFLKEAVLVYTLLFKLAWETLKSFGLRDKKLMGNMGAIAVLHTNTRSLDFHPHVHFVIPAGAIDKTRLVWRKKEGDFLFHQDSLAKVFHAKWIDAIKKNDLSVKDTIPSHWVVNCQHVGHGNRALTYLGKYLYRGVLPEKNIIENKSGQVTFSYKNNKGLIQKRTLAGGDFLWLLLKHVLPRGFRRARDFGFLHGNCKKQVRILQVILRCFLPSETQSDLGRASFSCPKCGGSMTIVATRLDPGLNLLPNFSDP